MLGPFLDMGRALVPLGLFHEDHEQVHEACLRALRRRRRLPPSLAFYEDSPYRAIDGGLLVEQRLKTLDAGLHRVEVHGHRSAAAKEAALGCYRSQLAALESVGDGTADARRPEGYWVANGDGTWL
jgi:LmbE family N-acetylglucosaminyl deacetylase